MKKCWPAFVGGCVWMAGLVPVRAPAQLVIRNEDAAVKFGVLGQVWGDWNQQATGSQNYQQNFYLRRIRLMVGGEIGKNISFFFETDDPRLGANPKSLNSGFLVQDALLEWKADPRFSVVGGLMLVPFSRNTLQSPASYYSLDIGTVTAVNNIATQSSGLRDVGFEAKGFFLKDKLLYRVGTYSGHREADGHNSLRTAGYLQYDFFDAEKGYTLVGTALGKQKILAVDAGFDTQGSYRALSANVAADIPVRQGDEIGGQVQYFHYDGRQKFPTIAKQNDYLVEAAYYLGRVKVQPFVRYESQYFVEAADQARDIGRYGTGANYYIRGQNLKWTFQYLRAIPRGPALKPCNEFSLQLQLFYY